MNLRHLRTFLWLRWRLRANQMKRAAWAGALIQRVLIVCGVLAALLTFSGSLILGLRLTPDAAPPVLMLLWDGLIVAFLFFWLIGLLTELQRSELLSVDKFLHLPVSPSGVFLINYAGSILTPSIVVFVPAMTGLALALGITRGPALVGLFPLLAAFIVVVTALTYQFRGWLAALMLNKRRRRTVLMVATLTFVLVTQIPYLVSRSFEREDGSGGEVEWAEVERVAGIANRVVPLGWLPYGAMTLAQGRALPAVLGTLGLLALGGASLGRSYRTTLRLYGAVATGGLPRRRSQSESIVPRSAAGSKPTLMEWRLPWLSEHASSIALTSFRSLTRAPEAKIMLLTPVILSLYFGGVLTRQTDLSPLMRPLAAMGAFVMVLVGMLQLAANQFGFDRAGFRAFVLSPASRKDILLGKNLALMPLALVLGTAVLAVLQWVQPMRADHFLATLVGMPAMYLVFCLVANLVSIYAPVAIASGSLKPVRPKGTAFLLNLVSLVAFPVALAPTLLPLGVEAALAAAGWSTGAPVYLILALLEAAFVAGLYPRVLEWEGRLFQAREQQILEVVAARAE